MRCAVSAATTKQAAVEEAAGSASAGEQDYLDEVLLSMGSDDESVFTATSPRAEANPTSDAEQHLLLQVQCAPSLEPRSPPLPT
jgi:hypothetical protein